MHKLFFWNNWHNGDLVLCRPLARHVLDRHDVEIAWGCWRNQAYIVEDLPVRVIADANNEPAHNNPPSLMHLCPPGHVPIYLWVGAFPDTKFHLWEYTLEIYNRQVTAQGLASLRIDSRWVPMMDFPLVDVAVADNAVFVENGGVRAFHSDFEFDMADLSREFPGFVFYCSAPPGAEAPNLVDCSRLNLVQLSSVSNKCDAIVGKGSGPFCSTLTEFNRYKPKAIMRYHPHDGPTLWDYPGNPLQYLETRDELVRFLHAVRNRRKLYLPAGAPAHVRNADRPPPIFEAVSAEMDYLIQKFRRNPADGDLHPRLRQARARVMTFWRDMPAEQLESAYRGAMGKTHRQLTAPDVSEACAPAVAADPETLPAPPPEGADPSELGRYLLINMYVAAPHELRLQQPDLTRVPDWLLNDYLLWHYTLPPFFRAMGESLRYARWLDRWVEYLHRNVVDNPTSMFWKKMAQTYLFNQTCMAAYFNDLNLRDLYSRRGDILEVGARELGLQLEHEFGPRPAGRPIRLGILSSHFHPSAETHAALPLFEHLGKEFEVYLYCFQATEHPLEQYVRDRCKSFKLLPPALDAQAQAVRQDDLDILFFATNVTAGTNGACALGLHRLARAQATSISAVTTSGLPKMDYYISGTWTDPAPDAAEHYRERLLRMDGSAHCFSCGNFDPPPTLKADRAAWGVAPRDVLFASGANYHKLIPEFLDTCMKILSEVPGSHLMLMPFGPHWSHQYPRARFMDHIWDMARRRDVAPSRVHILNVIPAPERQDIKELIRAADVYLDSYPFGGSTSLMEPLETGVPVVVQRGSQLRGAMASGIMRELGLAELIADDEPGYIRIAVELARDPELRRRRADATIAAMNAGPRFKDSRLYAQRIAPLLKSMLPP